MLALASLFLLAGEGFLATGGPAKERLLLNMILSQFLIFNFPAHPFLNSAHRNLYFDPVAQDGTDPVSLWWNVVEVLLPHLVLHMPVDYHRPAEAPVGHDMAPNPPLQAHQANRPSGLHARPYARRAQVREG